MIYYDLIGCLFSVPNCQLEIPTGPGTITHLTLTRGQHPAEHVKGGKKLKNSTRVMSCLGVCQYDVNTLIYCLVGARLHISGSAKEP